MSDVDHETACLVNTELAGTTAHIITQANRYAIQ
jgi:hypothetical protein